jgi:NAD(P)-dependent dehydrogenase (short-subunit alcohol dehydrogenase family)
MASLPRNGFGKHTTAQQALRDLSLAGKVAVVTGAGAGLGAETARVLALGGARVVMAVRNVPAGESVARGLRASLPPSAALEVMPLDLADTRSIRAFARDLQARHPALHLLINNAGVMATPLGRTTDGFETQMGINHLGHFLLTTLLLDRLRSSAPARVVVVASNAHRRGSRDGVLATLGSDSDSDPHYHKRKYQPFVAYGDSKLANIVFARALAHRLAGSGVTALSLHPGVIPTQLSKHLGIGGAIYRALGPIFQKSVAEGAATTIFAATAPELTEAHAGIYLADCNQAEPRPFALDPDLAERTWTLSEAALAARA